MMSAAGIYHCVQRAVRRAFLSGQDTLTDKNFEHRKAWIQQRLEFLAGQFGSEVLNGFKRSSRRRPHLRRHPSRPSSEGLTTAPRLGTCQ